jgi:tetrapyrrole methylase family protein/MazG family protein
MTVTILGLGPGDPVHLTRQVWDRLNRADEVYLRTARHPTSSALPGHLALHSFDHLYEASSSFDAVYEAIAQQIVTLGRRPQGVLYAVPGHPLVGESSVQRILNLAADQDVGVHLLDGLSFVEPVLSLLGLDGLAGLQLADATDLAVAHHPLLDTDRPALVGQLYGQRLASEVKLTLMNAYPEGHPVTLVYSAGTQESRTASMPLYELDRGPELDHLTTLYVPSLRGVSSLAAFQDTIARLRAPDGCPWDREQTHETLRGNLLEESYEVLAALDAEDEDKLCEELGDLLMQITMHVQIATEAGAFQSADVISYIDAKLKRRHPHVFGDLEAHDTATVLRNWEAIKAHEREAAGHGDRSRMGGIPTILPALARAQSLGDRAARDGFDWPDLDGVLNKVDEEARSLAGCRR